MRRILPVRPLDDHFAVQLDLIGKLLRGEQNLGDHAALAEEDGMEEQTERRGKMTMGKKHAVRNTCASEIKWIENSPVCRCISTKGGDFWRVFVLTSGIWRIKM